MVFDLENEFLDFENHHQNKFNLMIHIIAGSTYMAALNIPVSYTHLTLPTICSV